MASTFEAQTQQHFNYPFNNNLNPNAQEYYPNHSLNYNYYHTYYHYDFNYPFNNNNNFQYCPSQLPLDNLHLYNSHHVQSNNIVQNYHITPPPPLAGLARPKRPAVVGPGATPARRSSARGRKTSLGFVSDGDKDNNSNKDGGRKGQNGKFKSRVSSGWRRERKKVMEVKADGDETTVMIRNIPNQYNRSMLTKFLDEFCNDENQKLLIKDNAANLGSDQVDHPSLAFDFLYLPIDFETKANKGYAFVNFTHPRAVWKLYQSFSDKEWKHCCSSKKCQIACAAIQGKEKLVEHFGKSRFVCDNAEYLPVCFSPPREGSGASVTKTTVGELIPLLSSHLSKIRLNNTKLI